ncbi:hypothetical protein [Sinomonas sp. G460-2]|uniref:hypothetical protein n=1 Tax=Sinomonas sp. G460-2 TaxID=3393464 RepID=UPI0039EEB5D0
MAEQLGGERDSGMLVDCGGHRPPELARRDGGETGQIQDVAGLPPKSVRRKLPSREQNSRASGSIVPSASRRRFTALAVNEGTATVRRDFAVFGVFCGSVGSP